MSTNPFSVDIDGFLGKKNGLTGKLENSVCQWIKLSQYIHEEIKFLLIHDKLFDVHTVPLTCLENIYYTKYEVANIYFCKIIKKCI